jgi:hypothetical protein
MKFRNSNVISHNSKAEEYVFSDGNYCSETRVLKKAIIQILLVFERKILRRIFGPTKENQILRVKTNEGLDKLIKQRYN